MPTDSSPADRIRGHLARVTTLRAQAHAAGDAPTVQHLKRRQAERFRVTYADLLLAPRTAPAVRFFLEELYGARDFADRDAQFGRIAGAIETMFPAAVSQVAVDLAELHALTETLDASLARAWLALEATSAEGERYVRAWRRLGAGDERRRQLAVVQALGVELERLTRSKSLRLALRMMRQPARAAGLDALQRFLELGFDAFATMGNAGPFLIAIQERESQWLAWLDRAPEADVAARLDRAWHDALHAPR